MTVTMTRLSLSLSLFVIRWLIISISKSNVMTEDKFFLTVLYRTSYLQRKSFSLRKMVLDFEDSDIKSAWTWIDIFPWTSSVVFVQHSQQSFEPKDNRIVTFRNHCVSPLGLSLFRLVDPEDCSSLSRTFKWNKFYGLVSHQLAPSRLIQILLDSKVFNLVDF
jgi:hypothetical protein